MLFIIIDQNGEHSARELPHKYGNHPSRPWMWEPQDGVEGSKNIFWSCWNSQPEKFTASLDDGCVVINHKKKWLGSVQTYSSVLRYTPPGYVLIVEDLNSKGMQELKMLWDAQRFTQYMNRTIDDIINMRFDCEIQEYSMEQKNDFKLFCQEMARQQVYSHRTAEMLIDPPMGWTFEEWGTDDPEGYQRLLEEVALHSEIPYSWVEAWRKYLPTAQDIFNGIQSEKQKQRIVPHLLFPSDDTKKKI